MICMRRKFRGICLAALMVLFAAGCGGREVEVTRATRGPIEQSFTEPGKTRLENTWPITLQVAGRIARIDLEPGDRVAAGQRLVQYDLVPFEAAVTEAREAVAEIEASIAVKRYNAIEQTLLVRAEEWIKASRELLKAADEEVAAQKARSDRAAKQLDRVEQLVREGAESESALDDARLDAETSFFELKKEQFTRAAVNTIMTIVELSPRSINEWLGMKSLQVEELQHRLMQARARLVRAEHELSLTDVVSPVDGVVLERYQQGDAMLPAGTKVLLLGNLEELEVEIDVLTQDALKLAPGAPVELSAGAALAARGTVKRIEPAGFTKLSSLGVEQQRVNVIVSLDNSDGKLGVGFRVSARFITASAGDALKIPRFSVLESPDGSYYVFRVVDGALVETPVEIGLKSDLKLEITSGLAESDIIVEQPDTTMSDGMEVTPIDRR